ncbi:MAG: diheme cytochrome c [Motiliproteus sp.]|nr:diheme cytochrome c [Motiliproteus sp.]MCW9052618.1 diheme cytochrome c [Motiliproteus sp.]
MTEQLSTWRWTLGGVLLSSSLAMGIWGLSTSDVRADRDEYEREHEYEEYGYSKTKSQPSPLYNEECGSCHLAYPAYLLPAGSWSAMMNGLEDHFGENAELEPQDQQAIEQYLVGNAADNGRYANLRYAATIDGNLAVPLRITELPFFIREHDEVPQRMVEGNEQVGSFSQCDACHTEASRGRFDEDQIHIPGYGRWDD